MTYWMHQKTCAICDADFTASRSDATFCGANCRKKASRESKALDRTAGRAEEALRSLEEYIRSDHRLRRDALKHIEQIARDAAALVEEYGGQRHIYRSPNTPGAKSDPEHSLT